MATYTSKIGMIKPAGGEFVKRDDLNTNFDNIDDNLGTLWVNDGVIPAPTDLFHGREVRELTSGKRFTAKDNGGGGFTLMPSMGLANNQWGVYHFNASGAVNATLTALGNTVLTKTGGTLSDTDVVINTGPKTLTLTKDGIYRIQISVFISGSVAAFARFVEIKCAADTTWDTREPENNSVLWTLNGEVYITGVPRAINFNCQQDSGGNRDFDATVKISRSDIA